MIAHWWITTDNVVWLKGLKDPVAGTYINDATITAQMTDADGMNIGSSIDFSYKSASNGEYFGIVPDTLPLADGSQYTLTITATSGAYKLTVKVTRRAAYKGPDA